MVEFGYRLLGVCEPDCRHTDPPCALHAHVEVVQEDHLRGRNVKSIADGLVNGGIGLLVAFSDQASCMIRPMSKTTASIASGASFNEDVSLPP